MKYVGKCIYSKKSCSWENYFGSGLYISRAIKKYGKENFYKIIIDEADTEEELRDIEEYYIKMLDAVNSSDFYNLKDSSIGGNTFPKDEERASIRRKNLSKATSGKNNPMYGKEKTKAFLDAIKKSNSHKVKILDGEKIIEFDSKSALVDYCIKDIVKNVEYDKEKVKNLKRTVQYYIHNKTNAYVYKGSTKKCLEPIKERIDKIEILSQN